MSASLVLLGALVLLALGEVGYGLKEEGSGRLLDTSWPGCVSAKQGLGRDPGQAFGLLDLCEPLSPGQRHGYPSSVWSQMHVALKDTHSCFYQLKADSEIHFNSSSPMLA